MEECFNLGDLLRFTPKLNSLYFDKLWSTLSNALLKSIITSEVGLFTIFKIIKNFLSKIYKLNFTATCMFGSKTILKRTKKIIQVKMGHNT